MRSFIAFTLLLACSNDTFTDSDASTDGGNVIDQQLPSDVATAIDAAPDATDTSTFDGDAVLWFDAEDAVVSKGLVTSWPSHKVSNPQIHTTILTTGSSTCGMTGIQYTASSVNNKPSVQFCQALMRVDDDPSLQLGSSPFMITAVMRTANAATSGVLITKAQPGQTFPFTQLALWGRTPTIDVEGDFSSGTKVDLVSQSQNFVYVSFVRLPDNTINIRLEGQSASAIVVVSTDDVSLPGNPYQIGGSIFDVGDYRNIFGGDLAELIVLRNTTDIQIGHVELYLKTKYNLQ